MSAIIAASVFVAIGLASSIVGAEGGIMFLLFSLFLLACAINGAPP